MKIPGADEKREFFRIRDRLLVEFRQVSFEESLLLERSLKHTFSFHSPSDPRLSELPTSPPVIRDLFAYMEVLDRKLNMIIDVLLRKDDTFQSRYLEVDISGAGIRFGSDRRWDEGSYMELRIILPCFPDVRIGALGRVTRSHESLPASGGGWETAVGFVAMSENDRDILINYVFSKEREHLRVRKTP
jgi:hypothetical protein